MRERLIQQFANVGLTLELLDKPLIRGRAANAEIFQMDIARKVEGTRRIEWFKIYPGHADNVVQIIDIDRKLNQILLLVREPEREFEVEERKHRNPERVATRKSDLVSMKTRFRETATHIYIIRKTPAGNRHFLMGVDERQLFIAQLKNGVTNINEARKQLGSTVQFHEGKRKMTPARQGEWFFVEATDNQQEMIQLLLDKKRAFIVTKANIGQYAGRPRGNPHTADELVVIPGNVDIIREAQSTKYAQRNKDLSRVKPIYPIRRNEVFVRGCVRHQDHKTVKYSNWRQVILNNEGDTASATASWID